MLKRTIIHLPKAKRFNYSPRYYKGKEVHNPYDFESRLHRERETYSYNDFRAHWSEARESSRHRGNREINFRLLLIIAALVLLFLIVIDFDLSIFKA